MSFQDLIEPILGACASLLAVAGGVKVYHKTNLKPHLDAVHDKVKLNTKEISTLREATAGLELWAARHDEQHNAQVLRLDDIRESVEGFRGELRTVSREMIGKQKEVTTAIGISSDLSAGIAELFKGQTEVIENIFRAEARKMLAKAKEDRLFGGDNGKSK